jgi:hypothetical protein
MKALGVFRELAAANIRQHESIFDAVGKLDRAHVSEIAAYLESGVILCAVMGVTVDPLNDSCTIGGGPSLLSDGVWIWRADLAYFVRKYRVALPMEFVELVLAGPPPIDEPRVRMQAELLCGVYDSIAG